MENEIEKKRRWIKFTGILILLITTAFVIFAFWSNNESMETICKDIKPNIKFVDKIKTERNFLEVRECILDILNSLLDKENDFEVTGDIKEALISSSNAFKKFITNPKKIKLIQKFIFKDGYTNEQPILEYSEDIAGVYAILYILKHFGTDIQILEASNIYEKYKKFVSDNEEKFNRAKILYNLKDGITGELGELCTTGIILYTYICTHNIRVLFLKELPVNVFKGAFENYTMDRGYFYLTRGIRNVCFYENNYYSSKNILYEVISYFKTKFNLFLKKKSESKEIRINLSEKSQEPINKHTKEYFSAILNVILNIIGKKKESFDLHFNETKESIKTNLKNIIADNFLSEEKLLALTDISIDILKAITLVDKISFKKIFDTTVDEFEFIDKYSSFLTFKFIAEKDTFELKAAKKAFGNESTVVFWGEYKLKFSSFIVKIFEYLYANVNNI